MDFSGIDWTLTSQENGDKENKKEQKKYKISQANAVVTEKTTQFITTE